MLPVVEDQTVPSTVALSSNHLAHSSAGWPFRWAPLVTCGQVYGAQALSTSEARPLADQGDGDDRAMSISKAPGGLLSPPQSFGQNKPQGQIQGVRK